MPSTTAAPLLGEPLPIELMNTIWADGAGRHDELSDVAGLRGWLAAVADRPEVDGLDVTGAAGRSTLAQFRTLRDSLRVVAAAVIGDARPVAAESPMVTGQAVRELNRLSAAAPTWSELVWEAGMPRQVVRSSGRPLPALLSRIAGEAVRMLSGDAELRACTAPGCVLYYLRSHARREWCSAACGNRARVARHYARHRHGGTT